MTGRSCRLVAMLLATALAAGCTSAEKKAATAATTAQDALDQGQLGAARQYAMLALASRDDVSDYWLLLAHIDVAANDLAGAFDAYQNVLTLDKANVEALTAICQIALAGGDAQRAEKYVDQLALINPSSTLPATVRAAAALDRGDKEAAASYLKQVLDKAPSDLGALMVKSRLLAADDRYAEAAAVLEKSLAIAGNPNSRLTLLRQMYTDAHDHAGYARTVARLARANPRDVQRQLDYADILYDDGDAASAYAVTRQVLALQPDDIATASAVLALWLKQGGGAMPVAQLADDAAALTLEGKATYAQFADEIGRPDVALAILGDAPAGAPTAANSDAKAAAAFAIGLRGDRRSALAMLNAVLSVDPNQPRALLARARLRGDPAGALNDARRVLADDAGNVVARLTVADLLLRQGDALLAENTLREGLTSTGGDPRVAARLARLLAAQGEAPEAAAAVADFVRANPVSRRAATMAARGPAAI